MKHGFDTNMVLADKEWCMAKYFNEKQSVIRIANELNVGSGLVFTACPSSKTIGKIAIYNTSHYLFFHVLYIGH